MGEAGYVQQPKEQPQVETPFTAESYPVEQAQPQENESSARSTQNGAESGQSGKETQQSGTELIEKQEGKQPADDRAAQEGFVSLDGTRVSDNSWKGEITSRVQESAGQTIETQSIQGELTAAGQNEKIAAFQPDMMIPSDEELSQGRQSDAQGPATEGKMEVSKLKGKDLTDYADHDLTRRRVQGDRGSRGINPAVLGDSAPEQPYDTRMSPKEQGLSLADALQRFIEEQKSESTTNGEVEGLSLVKALQSFIDQSESDSPAAREAEALVDALQMIKGQQRGERRALSQEELRKGKRLQEAMRHRKQRDGKSKDLKSPSNEEQMRTEDRTLRWRWEATEKSSQSSREPPSLVELDQSRDNSSQEMTVEQTQDVRSDRLAGTFTKEQEVKQSSEVKFDREEGKFPRDQASEQPEQNERFASMSDGVLVADISWKGGAIPTEKTHKRDKTEQGSTDLEKMVEPEQKATHDQNVDPVPNQAVQAAYNDVQQPDQDVVSPSDRDARKLTPREYPHLKPENVGSPTQMEVLETKTWNDIRLRFDRVSTPEQVASYLFAAGMLPQDSSLIRSGEDPYLWHLKLGRGDFQYMRHDVLKDIQKGFLALVRLSEREELTQLPHLSQDRSYQIFRGELTFGNYELDGVFFSIRPDTGFPGAIRYEADLVKSEDIGVYRKISENERQAQLKLEAAKMWNNDMRHMLFEKGYSVRAARNFLLKLYSNLEKLMIAGTALAFANMGGSVAAEGAYQMITDHLSETASDLGKLPKEAEEDAHILADALDKAVVSQDPTVPSQLTKDVLATGKEIGTKFTGALGEKIARRVLSSRGYTDIIALQNTSGQGIDLVGRNKHGLLLFFEIKTSGSGRSGTLSLDQRDVSDYIHDRLQRITSSTGHYKNVSRSTRRQASILLDTIEKLKAEGRPIGGAIIDITFTLELSKFNISVRRWTSNTLPRAVRPIMGIKKL